jgi:hypothetical protein
MQQISSFILACVVAFTGTACSGESLQRFGYVVGAPHACISANEEHSCESAEDLRCTALQGHEDSTYDEYTAAREQALNEN